MPALRREGGANNQPSLERPRVSSGLQALWPATSSGHAVLASWSDGQLLNRRFTEPVALLSAASTDLPPSGLAAFRVQPLETTSTYSRSVLGARGNLALAAPQQQSPSPEPPQRAGKASLLLAAVDDLHTPELEIQAPPRVLPRCDASSPFLFPPGYSSCPCC
jgi:hypothetical protein